MRTAAGRRIRGPSALQASAPRCGPVSAGSALRRRGPAPAATPLEQLAPRDRALANRPPRRDPRAAPHHWLEGGLAKLGLAAVVPGGGECSEPGLLRGRMARARMEGEAETKGEGPSGVGGAIGEGRGRASPGRCRLADLSAHQRGGSGARRLSPVRWRVQQGPSTSFCRGWSTGG